MSLMEKVKGFFTGDADTSEPVSKNLYVIDTVQLSDSNGGQRPSPRDQFQMLQKLARFAEREKLSVCAILEGRPLREAADREDFNGVFVVYAEHADQFADITMQQLKKSGRPATLVTADRKLEALAAEQGFETLRMSTLRKAMDDRDQGSRGANGSGRGGDRGRRKRRPRPTRKPNNTPNADGNKETSEPTPNSQTKPQPQKQPSRDDVSDLIDLV
jgi:hypothetical protein